MTVVRILGLPVELYARAQEHSDELIRELTLIAQQMHEHELHRAVPVRLLALVEQLTQQYGGFTAEQDERMATAVANGDKEIDELVFHVPVGVAEAARQLGGLLDEVDEFCRNGQHLLTLETPPELVRFRTWYLGEFVRQEAGDPPLPWADYLD